MNPASNETKTNHTVVKVHVVFGNMKILGKILSKIRADIKAVKVGKAILNNLGWQVIDKVVRMGIGVVVGAWVARYLGPSQFGQLNYALAFAGLFAAFAPLGLKPILVRDFVLDQDSVAEALGTSILLQVVSGLVVLAIGCVSAYYFDPENQLLLSMVLVFSLATVLRATEPIKYWFEAKLMSKIPVVIENGLALIMSLAKIALILLSASVMCFVWLMPLESLVVAIAAGVLYKKYLAGHGFPKYSHAYAVKLLGESWPLIISTVSIAIYMKIDQVMLAKLTSTDQVGIYSAAVKLSEIWYFMPMAIIGSCAPTLIRAKAESVERYALKMKQVYMVHFYLALAVAVFTSMIAKPLVTLVYGTAYAPAGGILNIHIWAGVFVSVGIANAQWLLMEGQLKIGTVNTVLGAVMNVVLNLWLIPPYGASGAAVATLISYSMSAYFLLTIRSATRPSFYALNRAIIFR